MCPSLNPAEKGKIVRAIAEVGGWPKLAPGTAPVDSDQDGMPDAREKTHCLNPGDAADEALDKLLEEKRPPSAE